MKEYRIEIFEDENCESPDDWGNKDIFLVYEHRQFHVTRKGFPPINIYENPDDYNSRYYIFLVYAYIHSGIALSLSNTNYPFSCNFDVSNTGFILASKEEYKDLEEVRKYAEVLLDTWNMYLSGDTWGYKIIRKDTDNNNEEEIDSCYGFYGKDYCIEEATSILECYKKNVK